MKSFFTIVLILVAVCVEAQPFSFFRPGMLAQPTSAGTTYTGQVFFSFDTTSNTALTVTAITNVAEPAATLRPLNVAWSANFTNQQSNFSVGSSAPAFYSQFIIGGQSWTGTEANIVSMVNATNAQWFRWSANSFGYKHLATNTFCHYAFKVKFPQYSPTSGSPLFDTITLSDGGAKSFILQVRITNNVVFLQTESTVAGTVHQTIVNPLPLGSWLWCDMAVNYVTGKGIIRVSGLSTGSALGDSGYCGVSTNAAYFVNTVSMGNAEVGYDTNSAVITQFGGGVESTNYDETTPFGP